MSRKLPNCAQCGKPLVKSPARLRIEWDLPGRPEVGWCRGHGPYAGDPIDPLGPRIMVPIDPDSDWRPEAEAIIAEIDKRGPGRVVRNATAEELRAKAAYRKRRQRAAKYNL